MSSASFPPIRSLASRRCRSDCSTELTSSLTSSSLNAGKSTMHRGQQQRGHSNCSQPRKPQREQVGPTRDGAQSAGSPGLGGGPGGTKKRAPRSQAALPPQPSPEDR